MKLKLSAIALLFITRVYAEDDEVTTTPVGESTGQNVGDSDDPTKSTVVPPPMTSKLQFFKSGEFAEYDINAPCGQCISAGYNFCWQSEETGLILTDS